MGLDEEAPFKIRCPNCKRMVYSTSEYGYCGRCGKKLPAGSTAVNIGVRTSPRGKAEWYGLVNKYHLKGYVAFRAAIHLLKERLERGDPIEKLDPHWE